MHKKPAFVTKSHNTTENHQQIYTMAKFIQKLFSKEQVKQI